MPGNAVKRRGRPDAKPEAATAPQSRNRNCQPEQESHIDGSQWEMLLQKQTIHCNATANSTDSCNVPSPKST